MLNSAEILQAKILVVDDQPANIMLLEKILANIGYVHVQSTMTSSEVAGLHQNEHFDLILLDLQMPLMDGFEVMQSLKKIEEDPYLPVLVITAQPAEKLKALQAGAKDFISKPFDLVELQTRIHNMLEVRLLYKKLDLYNKQLEQTVKERTEQLRISEARFRSFTELSSDWYWEQDATGEYVSLSGPVFDMLGIENRSADYSTTEQAAHPQWLSEEHRILHANIEARQPFLNFVYRRIMADGKCHFLQVSGEPIFNPDGRFVGYRGVGMELNDRRRPDIEAMRLRLAMNLMDELVLLIDPKNMCLVDANASAYQFFDLKEEGLADCELSELGFGNNQNLSSYFDGLIRNVHEQFQDVELTLPDGSKTPHTVAWRSFKLYDEWLVIASVSKRELISVFDGQD